jgi:hypothetical protein
VAASELSIVPLLKSISEHILNPIIGLMFAIALLVFFYGIFEFIRSETADKSREEGKKKILYGLIGMFIMFSAYGIIHLILNTFGVRPTTYPF